MKLCSPEVPSFCFDDPAVRVHATPRGAGSSQHIRGRRGAYRKCRREERGAGRAARSARSRLCCLKYGQGTHTDTREGPARILQSLKSPLDPPGITGLIKRCTRCCDLSYIIATAEDQFNFINASAAVVHAATLVQDSYNGTAAESRQGHADHGTEGDTKSAVQLLTQQTLLLVVEHQASFQGRQHANTLWALAKLGPFCQGADIVMARRYLTHVLPVLPDLFPTMNGQELGVVCCGLGALYRLDWAIPLIKPLLSDTLAAWYSFSHPWLPRFQRESLISSLWGLAILDTIPPPSWSEVVLKLVVDTQPRLSAQETALTLWCFAKLRIDVDPSDWAKVQDGLIAKIPDLPVQELSMITWAIGRLAVRVGPEMMDVCMTRSLEVMPAAPAEKLAQLCYSLTLMWGSISDTRILGNRLDDWLRYFYGLSYQNLSRLGPQDIANITISLVKVHKWGHVLPDGQWIYALVKESEKLFSCYQSGPQGSAPHHDKEGEHKLSGASLGVLKRQQGWGEPSMHWQGAHHDGSPDPPPGARREYHQALANICWALAKLSWAPGSRWTSLMIHLVVKDLNAFKPIELIVLLYSWARMGLVVEGTVVDHLLWQVHKSLELLGPREISIVTWSLCTLGHIPSLTFWGVLVKFMDRQLSRLDPENTLFYLWSCASLANLDHNLKVRNVATPSWRLPVYKHRGSTRLDYSVPTEAGEKMSSRNGRHVVKLAGQRRRLFLETNSTGTGVTEDTDKGPSMGVKTERRSRADMLIPVAATISQAYARKLGHTWEDPDHFPSSSRMKLPRWIHQPLSLESLTSIVDRIMDNLAAFNHTQLSVICWALAKLDYQLDRTSLRRMIGASGWLLGSMEPREVCALFWAFSRWRVDSSMVSPEWLGQVWGSTEEALSQYDWYELSSLMFSLSSLKVKVPSRWSAKVLASLSLQFEHMNAECLSQVVWAVAELQLVPEPDWIRSFLVAAAAHRSSLTDRQSMRVSQALASISLTYGEAWMSLRSGGSRQFKNFVEEPTGGGEDR